MLKEEDGDHNELVAEEATNDFGSMILLTNYFVDVVDIEVEECRYGHMTLEGGVEDDGWESSRRESHGGVLHLVERN